METVDVVEKSDLERFSSKATIGIDIGSRMAKAVLLTKEKLYVESTASSVNTQETAEYLIKKLLKKSQMNREEIAYIVATGYGRIALDFDGIATRVITEITCHGMGAHVQNHNIQTIVDIGGQDSKAIKIDAENGKVIDFVMNDKCAAGTGRFLEKVGELLELSLEDTSRLALESDKKIEMSSQCVVFAESEIVTLKAKGEKRADIIAAVNNATARRVKNLLNRIGLQKEIIFSGGVSHNLGMKKALEEVIGVPFVTEKIDMTFNGALGAAILAQKFYVDEVVKGN